MTRIFIFLNFIITLSFAQAWGPPAPGRMFRMGVLGFLFLVLVFLLFSLIFWGTYLFLVKTKRDKATKE